MPTNAPRYDAMSDDDLVKRALAGSISAFNALWERHQPACRSIIKQKLGNREDAEDVLAQLHLRLHKGMKRYRMGTNFVAWINAMAANLSLSWAEAMARTPIPSSVALPEIQDRLVQEQACGFQVGTATAWPPDMMLLLRRLPPTISAVAWLYASGVSYAGIADALDIPIGTVKSRISSAKRRLRDLHAAMRASRMREVKCGEHGGAISTWQLDGVMELSDHRRVRLAVLDAVRNGAMSINSAAQVLGVTRRMVFYLLSQMRTYGASGVRHGLEGRRSNRRIPDDICAEAIRLARTEYPGLGPSPLSAALLADHAIQISREKLRKLLNEAGLRVPIRRRHASCGQPPGC